MTTTANLLLSVMMIVLSLLIAAAGIYIGDTDDAPGAAVLGFSLMTLLLWLSIRRLHRNVRSR